jgi:outer membrane receptor for ferrienterochelin and colicins
MACCVGSSMRARADDIVVTGTRTPESLQKSTVRTDVVTRVEAERRGATHVGDALAGQLGVQVNPGAYGFLGGPSAIQIFGFDLNRVLVLEDGERVIGDVGGAIDLSSLPLTDVARVEVVPGPTSALFGTSAIGGVVNVISAPPIAPGTFGRARVEGRSYRWLLLQTSAGYRASRAWVIVDASLSRRDGIARTAGLPDLLVPDTRRVLAGIRAGVSLTDRIDLRLRARFIRDRLDGVESVAVPGLGRYVTDLPQTNDRIALHAVQLFDLGAKTSLRLSLGQQWAFATGIKDRRDSPLDETRRRAVSLSSFEGTLVHPFGDHTLVAGARFESERYQQTLERTIATDAAGTLATQSGDEVRPISLGSAALYSQLSLRPTKALTLLAGMRGELHRRFGGVAAPRLAFALRHEGWSFRGGIGRGFRAPTGKELGFTFDHSFYGYRVDGDPNVRPESSWGVNGDVGYKTKENLTLRLGGFANWVRDLIDIAEAGERTAANVDLYRYRNVGAARTAGLQLDATWPVRPWFRVELGYGHLWTRNDTADRPLPSRPPHTLLSSTRIGLPAGVELYVRWRLVSDAYVSDDVRSPAFQRLDARVSKTLWPAARGFVGVLNAFDERPTPGRIGDQRPFDGRVFYVGVTAELPAEE